MEAPEKASELLEVSAERDRFKIALAERVVHQESPVYRLSPAAHRQSARPEERRTAKIPDPPVLTDGKDPKFEDWVLRVNDKLAAKLTISQPRPCAWRMFKSRCGGRVAQQLTARSRPDSTIPYRDSVDGIDHLRHIFEDVNRSLVARSKFRALYLVQGTSFQDLLSDFTYLAAEGNVNQTEWKMELYHKLGSELKRAVIREYLNSNADYGEFVSTCSQLATGLEQISFQENKARDLNNPPGTSGNQRSGRTKHAPDSKGKYDGPMTDELRALLLKEGRCFYCPEPGHTSLNCDKKTAKGSSSSAVQNLEPENEDT